MVSIYQNTRHYCILVGMMVIQTVFASIMHKYAMAVERITNFLDIGQIIILKHLNMVLYEILSKLVFGIGQESHYGLSKSPGQLIIYSTIENQVQFTLNTGT